MEPNRQKIIKLLSALIAASAIGVMAVFAVALNEQTGTDSGSGATEAGGGMSTGVTVTTTTPPPAAPIAAAHPTMKAAVPKGFR